MVGRGKLSLQTGDMIIYLQKTLKLHTKTTRTDQKIQKVTRYKTDTQKLVAFLYTNKISEKVKVAWSCPALWDPMYIQCMEFSRPKYWSGQSFPSARDLPNPGTEPGSPALQADSLPAELQGIRKGMQTNDPF